LDGCRSAGKQTRKHPKKETQRTPSVNKALSATISNFYILRQIREFVRHAVAWRACKVRVLSLRFERLLGLRTYVRRRFSGAITFLLPPPRPGAVKQRFLYPRLTQKRFEPDVLPGGTAARTSLFA
jgi:hypothetical protein